MSTNPNTAFRGRAPRGCYATDEFSSFFVNEEGVRVTTESVEYSHPTHGVVGCLAYTYENEEFVSVEWVSYDPALVL